MAEDEHRPPPPEQVSALLLGAGGGVRMGDQPKAFLAAGGVTLLERAVAQAAPFSAEIIVGLRAEDVDRGRRLVGAGPVTVTAGGAERQDTVEILLALAARPLVMVHDVARPFATGELYARVLAAGHAFGAATPCLPASLSDSLGLRDGDFLAAPLPRGDVVRTQTPQAYRRDLLEEVCRRARAEGWRETSVATLLARAGHRVRIVPGDPRNLKITFPEDWERVREGLGE